LIAPENIHHFSNTSHAISFALQLPSVHFRLQSIHITSVLHWHRVSFASVHGDDVGEERARLDAAGRSWFLATQYAGGRSYGRPRRPPLTRDVAGQRRSAHARVGLRRSTQMRVHLLLPLRTARVRLWRRCIFQAKELHSPAKVAAVTTSWGGCGCERRRQGEDVNGSRAGMRGLLEDIVICRAPFFSGRPEIQIPGLGLGAPTGDALTQWKTVGSHLNRVWPKRDPYFLCTGPS
jgi:hypothetical protein